MITITEKIQRCNILIQKYADEIMRLQQEFNKYRNSSNAKKILILDADIAIAELYFEAFTTLRNKLMIEQTKDQIDPVKPDFRILKD